MSMDQNSEIIPLGQIMGVSYAAALTAKPWQLPAEALIVSAGRSGLGGLGDAARKAVESADWKSVDFTLLYPDRPQWLAVEPYSSDSILRFIVLACAQGPNGRGTSSAAAHGTAAGIKAALDLGVASMAVPLLGAGVIGLPTEQTAMLNMRAALETLTQAPASAQYVIFFGQYEQEIDAIWAAWEEVEQKYTKSTDDPVPASSNRPRGSTAADYSSAGQHELSQHAASIVERAITLASSDRSSYPAQESSFLFLSALASGRDGGCQTLEQLVHLLALATERTEDELVQLAGAALKVPVPRGISPESRGDALPLNSPVIENARSIAARFGTSPRVRVRHLLAAILTSHGSSPLPILQALGLSDRDVRQQLRRVVAEVQSEEDSEQWDEVLSTSRKETTLAGGMSRDAVDSKTPIPIEEDYLGVSVYATMLAALVTNRKTPLPLSIGLFGEWGSGKSYFMGLLREEIDKLAKSGNEIYTPEVVSIAFNAWHYSDTNIWASLGNEIFDQLAGPEAERRRDAIREEFADTSQRALELQRATDEAGRETARLRKEVEKAHKSSRVTIRNLAKTIANSPDFQDSLEKAWKQLGVKDEGEKAQLLIDETRSTVSELRTLKLALSKPWTPAAAWLSAVAVCLLVTSLFFQDAIAGWVAGGGLSALVVAVTWVTAALGRARKGMETLRSVAAQVNEDVDRDLLAAIKEDQEQLREAEARETVLQAQLDTVVQRAGELGRELSILSPGQQWNRFVTERASSDDYRRELGLISTIRRDFEQLVDLMKKWQTLDKSDNQPHPVDRIVLYIDDLDRCSPRQVVDVLQAVHLLLALDLFVVVVGVDPRWLLHSLQDQYAPVFIAGHPVGRSHMNNEKEQMAWQSTPQDYLEKIFNIPLVLPAISSTSFERLIRKLALDPNLDPSAGPRSAQPSANETDSKSKIGGLEVGRRTLETEEPFADKDIAEVPAEAGSEVAAALDGNDNLIVRQLTEEELQLLSALSPLVRSPRQAKRLLNLYRLVRSTRDLSEASAFLGAREFEAVCVLLGILTAHPRLLGQLITEPSSKLFMGEASSSSATATESWQEFVKELQPKRDSSGGPWKNQVSHDISDSDLLDWHDLLCKLEVATPLVTLPDLAAFKLWGPRIMRFSFTLSPLTIQAPVENRRNN